MQCASKLLVALCLIDNKRGVLYAVCLKLLVAHCMIDN